MCLRRLAASKGVASIILSDNHRTFIADENFLLEMQQDPAVQEHLSSNNIRCNFTTEGDTGPPYTPSLPLPLTTAVELQHSTSEGSEAEERSSKPRQPRRATLRQQELLRGLIKDDLL